MTIELLLLAAAALLLCTHGLARVTERRGKPVACRSRSPRRRADRRLHRGF